MRAAPLPVDEMERLQDLMRFQILDTEEEKDYNDIVQLAADICHCPVSLITFIDADRQWFKASLNMAEKETTRDISICSHAILQKDVMVVEDARKDKRFFNFPNVTGGMQIRFYAGAPIVSPAGHNLGTICVVDTQPRSLTAAQEKALKTMATMVSRLLELRVNARRLVDHSDKLLENALTYHELFEQNAVAQWVYDLIDERFIAVNKAATDLYGFTAEEFSGLRLSRIVGQRRARIRPAISQVMSHSGKDGVPLPVEVTFSVIEKKGFRVLVASVIDLSEKLRMQEEIMQTRQESGELIENARTDERKLLGRELHDNICQMLSSTNMYLDLAYTDADIREELIKKSQEHVISAIGQLRDLSRRMANVKAVPVDLKKKMHEILEPYLSNRNLQTHISIEGAVDDIGEDIKINLLRIMQEALQNISKHAEASEISVALIKKERLTLTVRDNGKGFVENDSKGIGLKNMHERAKQLGGKLNIHTSPNGTEITVTI